MRWACNCGSRNCAPVDVDLIEACLVARFEWDKSNSAGSQLYSRFLSARRFDPNTASMRMDMTAECPIFKNSGQVACPEKLRRLFAVKGNMWTESPYFPPHTYEKSWDELQLGDVVIALSQPKDHTWTMRVCLETSPPLELLRVEAKPVKNNQHWVRYVYYKYTGLAGGLRNFIQLKDGAAPVIQEHFYTDPTKPNARSEIVMVFTPTSPVGDSYILPATVYNALQHWCVCLTASPPAML